MWNIFIHCIVCINVDMYNNAFVCINISMKYKHMYKERVHVYYSCVLQQNGTII